MSRAARAAPALRLVGRPRTSEGSRPAASVYWLRAALAAHCARRVRAKMGASTRSLLSAIAGLCLGWWIASSLARLAVNPSAFRARRAEQQMQPTSVVHQDALQKPSLRDTPSPAPPPSEALFHTLPEPQQQQHKAARPAPTSWLPLERAELPFGNAFAESSLVFTSNLGIEPRSLPLPDTVLERRFYPSCLWAKLEELCRTRFRLKRIEAVHAEWGDGALRCIVEDHLRGRVKRNNVELEVTLMHGCTPDVLIEPPPRIGTSSLPLDALERSIRTRESESRCLVRGEAAEVCNATAVPASADLIRLRGQLRGRRNASLSILAIGASITFMFADICTGSNCSTGPHESMSTFDRRLRRLSVRTHHKPRHAEEADWLLQLVRTLKQGAPRAKLAARSVAYGGMNPKAVASCVADFVAAPPNAQGDDQSNANLVILDFALFGGTNPFPEDWHAIEALVRSLYTLNVAVILINMPSWCIGQSGKREHRVHGHERCQRMIFDRSRTRANIRASIIPDRYDDQLTRVAVHYGQTAVSPFNALQPLISDGLVDVLDFTHDGKHPILFPRGTRRGSVLSRYMADLLAHAIDPTLLRHDRDGVWRGGNPEPQNNTIDVLPPSTQVTSHASWRMLPIGEPTTRTPLKGLPPALAPGLTSAARGVRCYGWGARGTRGSWKSIMFHDQGWNLTREELGYDEISKAWKPLAIKRAKPGLTSISTGDAMNLKIDTTLDGGSQAVMGLKRSGERAMVQLTYLQSYEQVGVLQMECVSGCQCDAQRIQTLNPGRLATLNTSLWPVTESRTCTLRFTNISPLLCGSTPGPCTKIKLVALAVAATPEAFDRNAATSAATAHVQSTADLGFL